MTMKPITDYCTRCGSINQGAHTCNPRAERSSCCNVRVFFERGKTTRNKSNYYCVRCNQSCDIRKLSINIEDWVHDICMGIPGWISCLANWLYFIRSYWCIPRIQLSLSHRFIVKILQNIVIYQCNPGIDKSMINILGESAEALPWSRICYKLQVGYSAL